MTNDRHFDVVVIGAGLAGLRAALAAAEQGASVGILEKRANGGGSTVSSGGALAFFGTDVQSRAGVDDSAEALRRDLRFETASPSRQALIDIYIDRQMGEYEAIRRLGAEIYDLQKLFGHSLARCHRSDARRLFDLFLRAVDQSDRIEIHYSMGARRLIRDADGKVTGAVAGDPSAPVRFLARQGVILASGGLSRSRELLRLFRPVLAHAALAGGEGNTGDGLRMAWELGADFADVGHLQGSFGVHAGHGVAGNPIYAVARGAIAVNKSGDRFADESLSYKRLGDICLTQEDGIAYQIFDSGVMAESHPKTAVFNFRAGVEDGRIVEADSIEALADAIEIPHDRLKAVIADYNDDALKGRDRRFGRTTLSGSYGAIRPLDRPPFYAFPSTTVVTGTYAGLRIDETMAVVDVWGIPIPGLYAAGEVAGGFHGETYLPGTALVMAMSFGSLAAVNAIDKDVPKPV